MVRGRRMLLSGVVAACCAVRVWANGVTVTDGGGGGGFGTGTVSFTNYDSATNQWSCTIVATAIGFQVGGFPDGCNVSIPGVGSASAPGGAGETTGRGTGVMTAGGTYNMQVSLSDDPTGVFSGSEPVPAAPTATASVTQFLTNNSGVGQVYVAYDPNTGVENTSSAIYLAPGQSGQILVQSNGDDMSIESFTQSLAQFVANSADGDGALNTAGNGVIPGNQNVGATVVIIPYGTMALPGANTAPGAVANTQGNTLSQVDPPSVTSTTPTGSATSILSNTNPAFTNVPLTGQNPITTTGGSGVPGAAVIFVPGTASGQTGDTSSLTGGVYTQGVNALTSVIGGDLTAIKNSVDAVTTAVNANGSGGGGGGGGGGGTVAVSNFPSVQPVSGTVNVGNLPSVQAVTGTVGISGPVAVTGTTTVSNPGEHSDLSGIQSTLTGIANSLDTTTGGATSSTFDATTTATTNFSATGAAAVSGLTGLVPAAPSITGPGGGSMTVVTVSIPFANAAGPVTLNMDITALAGSIGTVRTLMQAILGVLFFFASIITLRKAFA
jgi:collagen type VII alpha